MLTCGCVKAAKKGCGRAAFGVGELLQLELIKGEDWAPKVMLNLSSENVRKPSLTMLVAFTTQQRRPCDSERLPQVTHQVNACAEWYYNASILGSVSIMDRLEKLLGDNATVYWPDDHDLHKAGSFQFAMARYHMMETPYDETTVTAVGHTWAWKASIWTVR